jgi:hypothetical protein
MKRLAGGLAALIIAMVALVGLSAAPAQAASLNECMRSPGNTTCNGYQLTKNDYCWQDSYVVTRTPYTDGGWQFDVQLRYSRACQSNFAYVEKISGWGWYEYSSKVRRASGPDGGYAMVHAGWTNGGDWSLSPIVYSPNNQAQACISTRANDQAMCTVYV